MAPVPPNSYDPHGGSFPYSNIPFDVGWDADSRAKAPKADDNPDQASGYFQHNGQTINLWITEIDASFSVSGQSGQSRMTREFFPRSFNTVTLSITGQVASTQEYNRLARFVRETHYRALQHINQHLTADQTITFGLNSSGSPFWQAPQAHQTNVIPISGSPPTSHGQSNVKGRHQPWVVGGYIKSIQAGAERHEVAPTFTIDFLVAASTFKVGTGIWGESTISPSALKTFLQLVNVAKRHDAFVPDPITGKAPTSPAASGAGNVIGLDGGVDAQVPILGSVWSAIAASTFGASINI